MEKKTATPKVAEQIDFLFSQLASGESVGNSIDKEAICMELYRLEQEYDVLDQVFEENGKRGVVNIAGRVLVPALYCGIPETYAYSRVHQRPVPVRDHDGKCALAKCDGTGTLLCNFEYDEICDLYGSPSYYICGKRDAKEGMLYGVLDKAGNELVPCTMKYIDFMFNGYSLLYADGKIGALSFDGIYIAPQFDELENEDIDFLRARKGNTWGYIDENGGFVED